MNYDLDEYEDFMEVIHEYIEKDNPLPDECVISDDDLHMVEEVVFHVVLE